MQNDKLKSYLHLNVIVFIWGFTAILGALISLDAVPLVWYRMSMASLFIFAWVLLKKKNLRLSGKDLMMCVLGGVIIALHWLTFFAAIKVSNVSITLAMISTGAFFASVLEPIFYKRKVIPYEMLFGLMVILGLYIIFSVETQYLSGILLALVSAFLSACFSMINGKLAKKADASVVSFYEIAVGAGGVSIYLFWLTGFGGEAEGFNAAFFTISSTDWWYLFILASVCTAYAFITQVAVMKHLTPYTVMLTINLEPIYGIFLAYLIFGSAEQMNPEFYYGALLILSTVILNGVMKTKRKIKPQTNPSL